MFPNEKARLMRMMDSYGIPANNEAGVKMDFTQRVTWLIEHANQQSVQADFCPRCGGSRVIQENFKWVDCPSCVNGKSR